MYISLVNMKVNKFLALTRSYGFKIKVCFKVSFEYFGSEAKLLLIN